VCQCNVRGSGGMSLPEGWRPITQLLRSQVWMWLPSEPASGSMKAATL
jgi:hypothetical protein